MSWLKRDMRKLGIVLAGLLFFLVFMVLVPMSAGAYEEASGLAGPGTVTVQSTPTEDATLTALNKEKLQQEIQQIESQTQNQKNWLFSSSTALTAAAATVIVALFGIYQWTVNRRDERRKELVAQDKELRDRQVAQDKELRAQAEERFKTAVAALGDENEATQVGGAILLRSFLNEEDEEIYGRYYTQIFDLAVAYLRLSSKSQPPHDPDISLPLTPLRQALIVVFKEAFPLARSQNKGNPQSLDATSIQLDHAYLYQADMKQTWMPQASLREASLRGANLSDANLSDADLSDADLEEAHLEEAILT